MLTKRTAPNTIADLRAAVDHPSHARYVDEVVAQAKTRGWRPGEPVAHLSRGGSWIVAAVPIRGAIPLGPDLAHYVTPAIGVCGADDTRHALTFYAGGRDNDWDAGFASDAWPARPAGQRRVEIEAEVETALDRWDAWGRRLARTVERTRNQKLTRSRIDRILIEAGRGPRSDHRTRTCPHTRVFVADALIRTVPDPSAWDVVCALGKVLDDKSPELLLDRLLAVWRLVTAPADRTAAEPEPAVV